MRKAIALVMVMLLCFSLSAMQDGAEVAVEGVCDGILASAASFSSEPRIMLQGVTADGGDGNNPYRISFVRSDVSTYEAAFGFFGNGVSVNGSQPQAGRNYLRVLAAKLAGAGLHSGDLILDGSVRLLENSGGILRLHVSVMASGHLVPEGAVVDGVFFLAYSDNTVTIGAESLTVNGMAMDIDPVSVPYST